MFGGDEIDRWDYAAAYAAMIVYQEPFELSFENGVPPKVDYGPEGRKGVEFTLHVPQNYEDTNWLFSSLHEIIKITFINDDLSRSLFKGNNFYDNLKPEFFRDSFILNSYIIQQFMLRDPNLVWTAAKQSLIGMAKQGLSTYERSKYAIKIDLTAIAIGALVEILSKDPSKKEDAQELIDNPDIQRLMPAAVQALKDAVDKVP